MNCDDSRLARTLFALFLVQCQRTERELFGKLCRAHPDLRSQLEPLFSAWDRMKSDLGKEQPPPQEPAK